MADTVEMKIFLALVLRLQAWTPPAGVNVVLPGEAFSPSAQSKFISAEVHFNRSIETDISLEGDPIRQGFFRANVFWPKASATVDAVNLAGLIREHFRRGTKLLRVDTEVRIDEDPEIGVIVTGDTHITVPVTIRWRCFP